MTRAVTKARETATFSDDRTVATVRGTHYYGSGGSTMSILLDEVDCQGDETNIFQCGFAPIGTTDCGHSEDVGVLCQGPTTSGRLTVKQWDLLTYLFFA